MSHAVLLVTLGAPRSTAIADVRRFLREFLMDRRVIDIPYLLRRILVSWIIVPRRAAASQAAYRAIWRPEGAPLYVLSERVRLLLEGRLAVPVGLAMRYGEPSIGSSLRALLERSARRPDAIVVVPLYPHYAMSTFESAVVAVEAAARRLRCAEALRVARPFFDRSAYVTALAESARPYLAQDFDQLLVTYHGLPERHLRRSDPTGRHCLVVENCCETPSPAHATCYRAQAMATTRAFVAAAGLPPDRHTVAFQSRFGKDPWLAPHADEVLAAMPGRGAKRVLVIAPSFVTDCLETLEELGIRGRKRFLEAGGRSFTLIPCLNDHPRWIEALAEICSTA
jgi:ferrochelatase